MVRRSNRRRGLGRVAPVRKKRIRKVRTLLNHLGQLRRELMESLAVEYPVGTRFTYLRGTGYLTVEVFEIHQQEPRILVRPCVALRWGGITHGRPFWLRAEQLVTATPKEKT